MMKEIKLNEIRENAVEHFGIVRQNERLKDSERKKETEDYLEILRSNEISNET